MNPWFQAVGCVTDGPEKSDLIRFIRAMPKKSFGIHAIALLFAFRLAECPWLRDKIGVGKE